MMYLKELLPHVNSEAGISLSWIGVDDKSPSHTLLLQFRLSLVPAVSARHSAGDNLQETLASEDLWNDGGEGLLTVGLWVGLGGRKLS